MACQQSPSDLQQVREVLVGLAGEHRSGAQQSPWATLAAGLPFAVAEPMSSRHRLQEELITILAENLQATKEATTTLSAELEEKLQAARKEEEQGNERATVAEATETQSAATLQEREAAQKTADEAVTVAEQERVEAEAVKKSTTQHLEKCTQEHEEASSVSAGALAVLVAGGWEDEEMRTDVLAAVEELLKRAGAEPTLLAAIQGTFRRKPEARGKFDQVVVSTVEAAVAARVAALQSALDSTAASSEEVNAEALGLWAISDLAKEAAEAAKKAVAEAKSNLGQAKRKRAESNSELKELQKISFRAGEAHGQAEAKARRLSDALSALERLRTQEPTPVAAVEVSENEGASAAAASDKAMSPSGGA
eukprot:TRINITY_DN7620_c0_g1_i1.p1 TRINITY_DN7620_c0_g1~~TRINITY_DN7620_c0_g1_i1.p1  ORF type:complete len:399 (-),score=127.43 TRINITY_DN7620_c0_g1_i1:141-1238(-)